MTQVSSPSASQDAAARGRPGAGALLAEQMEEAGGKRAKTRNIRPLARLLPFMMRHRMDAGIAGLWLISGSNPQTSLGAVAAFAVMVGFFGATQDIAIDAWRIEAADDSRQGAMAAAYQLGWRVAQITAGALPLILAELYNWNLSYAVMAALMAIGVIGVLMAPREKAHVIRAIPVGDIPSRPGLEVVEWIVRLGLIEIAALIIGTGLTDQADALAWALQPLGSGVIGAIEASTEAGDLSGVLIQFAYVIGGFALLTAACWPIARSAPSR